ncbi:hypothetical protein RN001_014412 [Aquatica leii]|uniref:Methyltransferase domain-containing protein n=1 Tax=Aquatica leii TaxID=1421715 RepID=A0AAN7SKI7_9COLE|nr:hypothetical protein RN001_014412 [Aquatica leii]
MEKPLLFIKSTVEAHAVLEKIFDQNLEILQRKDNCVVLDVGCGPGNVTFEKVLPRLPSTTTKLIGVDILSDNIKYARKHYQTDPRVFYEELDIRTDSLPPEYLKAFDLILSFYCLHYVRDHRTAFKNIHKMLKPTGKIFICFVKKSPISDMYQYVYKNPKWAKYMCNFADIAYIPQSETSFKNLLEEVGFKDIQYEEQETKYLYLEDVVFGIMKSVNLFNVPVQLEDEFIKNQMEYLEKNGYVKFDQTGRKQYDFPIKTIIINASTAAGGKTFSSRKWILDFGNSCSYNLFMDKPLLYINNSMEAQRDGTYVLNKNINVLQTNKNCAVLDVGCGPGNLTYETILPLLPNTTKKFIGVDISHNNIEYAKKHYQTDPRISFRQLDILTDQIPDEYIEGFDLVISLYCLQFVGDHKKAFHNIYKMVKPDGRILISFPRKFMFPDMYQYVYNNPKWKQYMRNFSDVLFVERTEDFYQKLLEELGFEQFAYEQQQKKFVHSEESVFDLLKSLNLFNVPEHLENEFIQNHLEYLENNDFVELDDVGRKQYYFPFTTITISASKNN